MKIKEIKEKDSWNSFFFQEKELGGEFCQSWEWGEFQKKLKRKIWRLRAEEGNKIIAQSLIIKYNLPANKSYFYCPRGPVFVNNIDQKRVFKCLVDFLKEIGKNENTIFLRTDLRKKVDLNDLKKIKDVQPSQTTILDLQPPLKKILSQMHSKTRYNIRLSKRKGVEVFSSRKKEDIEKFFSLVKETSSRENFKIYQKSYYYNLVNSMPNLVKIYFARYKEKILAAHCLIFFNKTATYLHGGSSREEKSVMAPYLVHWEAIKEAKEKGCCFYDFWGIDKNKWPGLTRFKINFGGKKVFYPGTFDYPIKKSWYFLYKLGKICSR